MTSELTPKILSLHFKLEEDSIILNDKNGESYVANGNNFEPPLQDDMRFEVDGIEKIAASKAGTTTIPQNQPDVSVVREINRDKIDTQTVDPVMKETHLLVQKLPSADTVDYDETPAEMIGKGFINEENEESLPFKIRTNDNSPQNSSIVQEFLLSNSGSEIDEGEWQIEGRKRKNNDLKKKPQNQKKSKNTKNDNTSDFGIGFLDKISRRISKHTMCNILLIGETGSGKSTLINYLTNFFHRGSLEKPRIAIPTRYHRATESWKSSEKDLHDATRSKTSECTVYSFNKYNCRYDFIDTPGLSDTEGTEQDDRHIEKIMFAAEKSGNMAAIIIVINGTVARATVNLRNTLVRLRGSVPDVLLNNLIVVLTNCSAGSANFDLESLKPWTVSEGNVFHMNNSALSKPKESWINNKKLRMSLDHDWQASMEEINEMILKIENLGHIATNAFGEMRQKREKIKAELHGILLEVKKLQTMQSELDSAKFARKGVTDNIKKYSNYKQNKQVDYVEMEETNYHNTICMQHTDKVCHEGCGLKFTTTAGDNIFTGCACMNGTKCNVCECTHATHYHAKKRPVKKTKTVEEILQDVKALYDQNTSRESDLKHQISTLSSDITILQKALKEKEAEIHECCRALKKLCSQFNFVAELNSVIDTMEANARTLTSMQARKEAENMIKNIVYLANELSKRE
ncbi:hypothetical protein FO519_008497 [Halicephalobus sp. NKZ332]|nr:hypothetical protein FO519_008497 [Halicephalobus sp. NKZ332]